MRHLFFIALWLSAVPVIHAQEINYDEDQVPDFILPEILTSEDGKTIVDAANWENNRRPEILQMFSEQMYGTIPEKDVKVTFKVVKNKKRVLDGLATLREIEMTFSNENGKHSARLLLFLPQAANKPVPLFLGLNFYGNHTIHPSSDITIHESWARSNPGFLVFNDKADENSRGVRSSRWPVEFILNKGYGLGVIYYGELDPDFDDGFQNGLHPLFYKAGQNKPSTEEWGSIGLWAWGLSKALDYLETDKDVASDKVMVFGHSRLGKTSLWAGAQDPRFAGIISNNSGCGGAALSKRAYGETVAVINRAFPHWFNDHFNQYSHREADLHFDQHMLIGLMAPRPVYIASAQNDRWADPYGEYLSGFYAGPVYRLYGKKGFDSKNHPDVNQPRMTESVSYHMRTGNHDVTRYDWAQYIQWADLFIR